MNNWLKFKVIPDESGTLISNNRRYKVVNEEIELLHKKIEAQDKIINEQTLEIARLKEEKKELKDGWQQEVYDKDEVLNKWLKTQIKIDKAIEYIDNNSYEETYTDENGITWLRFKMENVNDLKDILLGEKK